MIPRFAAILGARYGACRRVRRAYVSVLPIVLGCSLFAAACSGDSDGTEGTTSGPDVGPGDVSGTDDAAQATDASDGEDAAPPDTGAQDATAGCTPGTLACDGACGFNFTRVAPDRDGVNFVRLTFAPSPTFEITSLVIENAPQEVQFSNSYADYIARITDDEWVITDNRQGFVSGTPIEFTEPFEVEVLFEDLGGATEPTCPSGDRTNCGDVIVTGRDCSGVEQSIELNVRR